MSIDNVDEVGMRMDERERLLQEIFGDDAGVPSRQRPINTEPLFKLRDIWPEAIAHLTALLLQAGEDVLAATVDDLQVFDRCFCGADHCATVYTRPRPKGGFGPTHRNIAFWPPNAVSLDTGKAIRKTGPYPTTEYMTILDVVDNQIACIEILNANESRRRLVAALPDEAEPTST